MPTALVMHITEEATGRTQKLVLGEWHAAFAGGVTVGRADDCTVVLQGDGVAPVHARLRAVSNHRLLTALAPGVWSHGKPVGAVQVSPGREPVFREAEVFVDYTPFRLAGYQLQLGEESLTGEQIEQALRLDGPLARHRRVPREGDADWFGPHGELVQRVLALAAPERWLRPSADLAALSASARYAVEDRLTEHQAALAPLKPSAPPERPRVAYALALWDALLEWREAWDQVELRPRQDEAVAHLAALQAAWPEPHGVFMGRALQALDRRLQPPPGLLAPNTAAARALRQIGQQPGADGQGSPQPLGESPPAALARAALGWAMSRPDPCPFAPLLALWAVGCWPLAMPGGSWLVYVPTRRDERDPPADRLRPRQAALPPSSSGAIDRFDRCSPVMAYWSRQPREVPAIGWPAQGDASAPPAALVLVSAVDSPLSPGQRYPLGPSTRLVLTSSHTLELRSPDRDWCVIEIRSHRGGYYARDGGGFHTTSLNGKHLPRSEGTHLSHGDVLGVNALTLRFEASSG